MADRRYRSGDPGRRRIAFGTLTGLVSGFVVTLAVSLVVLGTTGAQSGLRLSIPGRHHTEQDSPDGATSTTIPTFGQPLPAAVTAVPVTSVSSTAGRNQATPVTHRTPPRVPATAGSAQTAVPITSDPSTTGPVAVPVDPPSTTVPPTVAPTVTTTEPEPPTATPAPPAPPAPTETASAAAAAP